MLSVVTPSEIIRLHQIKMNVRLSVVDTAVRLDAARLCRVAGVPATHPADTNRFKGRYIKCDRYHHLTDAQILLENGL